jgi:putative acetyltransferase
VIVVRPATPEDAVAVAAVHDAAFGGSAESRIVAMIAASPEHLPDLSLVAVEADADAGAVLGHVLVSRAWLAPGDARPDVPILVLGPIGVVPERQGEGIGSALMAAALGGIRARGGERVVVLLGHPGYYPRFGFAPGRAQGIEPPAPWPDRTWMALRLDGGYDTRGTVRLPAAFDEAGEAHD